MSNTRVADIWVPTVCAIHNLGHLLGHFAMLRALILENHNYRQSQGQGIPLPGDLRRYA